MGAEVEVRVACRGPHTIARDLNEPEPFCPICLESSDYPAPREGFSARLVDPEAVLRTLLEKRLAELADHDGLDGYVDIGNRHNPKASFLLRLLAPASPEEKPNG